MADKAYKVLKDAEAEQTDGKFHGRISLKEAENFYTDNLPKELKAPSCVNSSYLEYLGKVLQVDAHVNDWKRLTEYLTMISKDEAYAQAVTANVKHLFNPESTLDGVNDDGAIEIVNADFSLAYGSRMLLNKTNLRLLKGHRYGLCGRNGAGKSTLMRAISKGQLRDSLLPMS